MLRCITFWEEEILLCGHLLKDKMLCGCEPLFIILTNKVRYHMPSSGKGWQDFQPFWSFH